MSSKFLDKTGLDTLWAKIKSTFQTLGNLVTAWSSTPSDTKYPSEKLVKTGLDSKANDSAALHRAGLETAMGQKWFEGGFCVLNTSNVGYGHYTLPGTGAGTAYNNWPEEYKDGAHFREWSLSFDTGVNFWGKLRITIATSFSSFNASGSMQKTINCAFNTVNVFNNTGYYNDLGINTENEFRISDLIWNNTTACWEIKIHSIKPTSNNSVPVLLVEFWTYSTSNRDSALGIHWVSASPSIVTDTTYYTKRSGNASTSPGTGGVQFNWADKPVQQSPYGYEIFNRSHTIPVANGGTGNTSVTAGNYLVGNGTSALTEKTPNVAANDLINALTTGEATPTGDDYYVAQYAGGGTTTKTFHRRPVKALWEYIKTQISSVLGLTVTSYGGNAATATTAAGYTSGGAIDTALQGKQDDLGISSSGDAGKFLNEQGEFVVPTASDDVLVMNIGVDGSTITDAEYVEITNAYSDGKEVILQPYSTSSAVRFRVCYYGSSGIIASKSVDNVIQTLTISPASGSHTVTISTAELASEVGAMKYYSALSDISGSLTSASTIVQVVSAMADGSVLVAEVSNGTFSDNSFGPASGGFGTITIVRRSKYRAYVTFVGKDDGMPRTCSVVADTSSYAWDKAPVRTTSGNNNVAWCIKCTRLANSGRGHIAVRVMLDRSTDTDDFGFIDIVIKFRAGGWHAYAYPFVQRTQATSFGEVLYTATGGIGYIGIRCSGYSSRVVSIILGDNRNNIFNIEFGEFSSEVSSLTFWPLQTRFPVYADYNDKAMAAIGSSTHPVYVNANGQVVACNDAKFYSSGINEIDYTYKSHFAISSSQNGRGFKIDATKLAENVSYELGAVLVDSGSPRFSLKFKKTSSNYYLYGCRKNGTNLVSADVEITARPEDNVRVVRIGTNVYVIGY